MEAGLPPDIPQPPTRAYDQPRAAPEPSMSRSRPQMPPAVTTSRTAQAPIGVAISRPTQVPQWPLSGTIEGPDPRSNQQYQPPPGRSIPPQRPPRPSHVPSMLDASRLQEHTPSFQYQPQPERSQGRGMRAEEEDIASPILMSPMTQSSRVSTISSVGTIPDFPVPLPPPGPPRRSANLGPPPSARRGASSYYSQASFVSPIPEESPRTQPSHLSYASSAAIPSSWGSDSPGYQFDDDEDDEDITERGFGHDVIEEGRESRESNFDDNDDRGLIRSASLGKRAKPSMITTKSSDRGDQIRPSPIPKQPSQQMSKLERMGVIDGGIGAAGAGSALGTSRMNEDQRQTFWPIVGDTDSPLATGTGFIESSSSEGSVPTIARAMPIDGGVNSSPTDARATALLGAYNAASSLQPGEANQTRVPSPSFSRLSAIRRPPRLDMDAVRDAEARGSLTSLPDLIRRATRLAAMMDRGKRPASRLNDLNDFPMSSDEKDGDFQSPSKEKRRSGLSGMLAAFPPPGIATPREGTPTRPTSSWPSPYDPSEGPLDPNGQPREKKRRRCCGLPCWGFFLVIIILLIIIAAAVVIPLEFLVLNKPKTSSLSALQQCEANSTTACQNGGSSLIDNGCACICTNGFTGSTCSVAGASGCTTVTLSGSSVSNVTLGDSLPRLISGAQTNFSVPLSESKIVARLNSANLSCSSENALVTFDGQSQRVNQANAVVTPISATPSATSTTEKKPRDDSAYTTSSEGSASTSSGIVYDTSQAPSVSASATSSSASASATASFSVTEEVLDFARVAVLYVLQEEQIDTAESAQIALQKFFSLDSFTNTAASNLSLGSGNSINLVSLSIDVGSGPVGANNTSLSRRHFHHGRSANLWVS
ncbi:hypothetical protein LSUE1_G010027 [Lachnellula suecica]|uniref:EGF-like domain-containing protein n=1 Tax=Lachnellula suecica TaxID=602035 RepID=A0A8T9C5S8_9HELO|nr:hypothetical protein LSUE1_G010027 [Lachnellula suecica]